MLRLIRPTNLIIVAITQYLLKYLVLLPALQSANLRPVLDEIHFFLLVLTTVLIAAGGYVINDILDEAADKVNKPDRVFVGNGLGRLAALQFYGFLTLLGGGIAWYLADHIEKLYLFFIYPAAVFLLYIYSFWLKKTPLWGNIIVSLFCAGVAGIVLFSEKETFWNMAASLPNIYKKTTVVFAAYIVFAFLSTFLREIIKDIEDMEGDRLVGVRTFPIKYGVQPAKHLCAVLASLLMAGLVAATNWCYINGETAGVFFTIFAVIGPLAYLLYLLVNASNKHNFTILSQWAKWVMVSGLLLLIILWKY